MKEVLYLCDRKACLHCSKAKLSKCNFTRDMAYALKMNAINSVYGAQGIYYAQDLNMVRGILNEGQKNLQ